MDNFNWSSEMETDELRENVHCTFFYIDGLIQYCGISIARSNGDTTVLHQARIDSK